MVTVNCWRAFVGELDGTNWGSNSSDPVPDAWGTGHSGTGEVAGVLSRTASNEAVFTSYDGLSTTLEGGDGKQFFDSVCPGSGRGPR